MRKAFCRSRCVWANHADDYCFVPAGGGSLPAVEPTDAEMAAAYDDEATWDSVPDYLARVKGM